MGTRGLARTRRGARPSSFHAGRRWSARGNRVARRARTVASGRRRGRPGGRGEPWWSKAGEAGSWRSVHRRECLVVIARIVRFPCPLLDDDALGAAVLPADLRVDVVLAVAAARQPLLPISEGAAADVAWRR